MKWLPWLILLLYVAALNPYPAPNAFDNLVYYMGGKAFAESGIYAHGGIYDVGWAPGFPLMLSVPFSLGWDSLLVGKILVVACTLGAFWVGLKLFANERRPFAIASFALFALSPHTLLLGSRLFAEMPYMLLSLLFLWLLQRRKLWFITACVLVFALMTRYVGALLLLAVAWQGVAVWRKGVRPWGEISLSILGLAAYAGWKGYIHLLAEHYALGEVWNFHIGSAFFRFFDVPDFLWMVSDYFFDAHLLVGSKPTIATFLVGGALATLMGIGVVTRVRRGRFGATDAYVLAMLAVVACFQWGMSRYLVPIGPFLFSYFFTGLFALWKKVPRTVVIAWGVAFLALDVGYLTLGNGHSFRGMCWLISQTPEQFYKGYWHDLYKASRYLLEEGEPGAIDAHTLDNRDIYVAYFTGRRIAEMPAEPVTYRLIDGEVATAEEPTARFGPFTILSLQEKR